MQVTSARIWRARAPIGPYDCLIAAQARRRGATLVTANAREFARVPGLFVDGLGGVMDCAVAAARMTMQWTCCGRCRRVGAGCRSASLERGWAAARLPRPNTAFWTNGNVPWVSPKDMKVEIIGETEDKVTAEAVEGSSAKYVPAGSVLMVMRSGILKHSFPVAVTDRISRSIRTCGRLRRTAASVQDLSRDISRLRQLEC